MQPLNGLTSSFQGNNAFQPTNRGLYKVSSTYYETYPTPPKLCTLNCKVIVCFSGFILSITGLVLLILGIKLGFTRLESVGGIAIGIGSLLFLGSILPTTAKQTKR